MFQAAANPGFRAGRLI
uniref:Uncharacterized protein n=1 Tax=Arundo donax TaxID=35708 RepID=A0A0A8XRP9_ARUDO